MIPNSPREAVELLDDAFSRGDVEGVLTFYQYEAVLVVEPGRLAKGKKEQGVQTNRRVETISETGKKPSD